MENNNNDADITVQQSTDEGGSQISDDGKECFYTGHGAGDARPITPGSQTPFGNASIEGRSDGFPKHPPWVVDIDLPNAPRQLVTTETGFER